MHGRYEDLTMRRTRRNVDGIAWPQAPVTTSTIKRTDQSGIRVRLIDQSDREAARALLRQHHTSTVFRDQTFSDWKFERHFNTACSRPPNMVALAAECNGDFFGGAWATIDQYFLTEGPPFLTVQVIAVDQEKLGPVRRAKVFLALVAGIREWARSVKASHSFVHLTTGSKMKSTDRLMKAAGALGVGGAYVV
jgi:hypothetical protein